MNSPVVLTSEQEQFLAHACAFIATNPAQDELDKLFVLATMLLPAQVAQSLNRLAGRVWSSVHA